jgi:putative ABC transport system ATP-binding protein
MIKTDNLVKKYKTGDTELVVLKDLELHVKKGDFISITGRSGSGKSTLLYQLGLLDRPFGGSILIDGVDILALSDAERTGFRLKELGYVFQDYALLPELTALENVALPLLMHGESKEQAYEKAKVALARVNLADKLPNLPSQLSGGQQQRVSIARAIAHSPKIIFADEPTANLDSETAEVVLDTFIELHKEGQTIVMVTHEQDYAQMSDRIVTLSDGKVVSDVDNRIHKQHEN